MAYSVRVKGISKDQRPILIIEPPWWDADELMKDNRFVVSNETGSYFDHDADLSVEEAKDLHSKYREEAITGLYGGEAWQKRIRPMLEELDKAFGLGADKYSHFHVTVFEWESGY